MRDDQLSKDGTTACRKFGQSVEREAHDLCNRILVEVVWKPRLVGD